MIYVNHKTLVFLQYCIIYVNHKTLIHMHPINLASLELKEGDSDTIQYK